MANYVVSDTNLTLIADAIRAKSGHNELLEWPNEYKTSIDNLNPVDMCIKTATDDVVSVSDAAQYDAKNVSIKIEPMQNLHGYDHPWPAGGGVNVLDFAQYFTEGETVTQNGVTATFSNGYLKVTGTNTTSTFNIIYKACNVVLPAGTYIMPKNLNIRCNIDDQGNNNYAGAITAESSVQMVAFYVFASTGATVNYNIPMMMVKGETRPTVYSPYANICPITGWTGAKVTRTGKNLLSPHLYSGIAYNPTVGAVVTLTDNPVQFTDEGNGVFSVQTTATWRYFALIYPIDDVNLSHVYSLSWASTGQFGITRGFLDENHTVLTKFNTTDASGNWVAQFEPTATAKYLYFVFTNRGTASATLTITQPQIELGSTATDYEPYVGDTYPITFPSEAGTVYGGTLDIVNGVLTVDRAMVDLGTLTWTKITTSGDHWRFWAMLNTMRLRGQMISSQYRQIGATEQYIGAQGIANQASESNVLAMVSDERYADTVAFKAAMSGVQLVYELATPVTYQLTPQQIALLRGNNNVWADTGDATLKYFTTAFEDLAEEIGFADGGDY